MKKALLISFVFLFSAIICFGYETIIINYPNGEVWERAYYKKIGNEALLQYVPQGQTTDNWTRSIVIHSYKGAAYPINYFITNNASRMQKSNPTAKYKTIKMRTNDAMLTRCTDDYKNIQAQCEFFRATYAHEGIITIHYMNKNKIDFMNNYTLWLEIIRKAKLYNSYYRNDRTFNKSEFYELW